MLDLGTHRLAKAHQERLLREARSIRRSGDLRIGDKLVLVLKGVIRAILVQKSVSVASDAGAEPVAQL